MDNIVACLDNLKLEYKSVNQIELNVLKLLDDLTEMETVSTTRKIKLCTTDNGILYDRHGLKLLEILLDDIRKDKNKEIVQVFTVKYTRYDTYYIVLPFDKETAVDRLVEAYKKSITLFGITY